MGKVWNCTKLKQLVPLRFLKKHGAEVILLSFFTI